MTDDQAASVYIVCGSAEEAETIATALVEERLAACCNILGPATSIYRWQGKVERATEVPMIAKSVQGQVGALVDRVRKLHSYDNPAITVWPITGLPGDYHDWILANVGPKKRG
ncbi:divalent-cation tolerance protein CutA [Sphingomicrobium arenosum]|uniref:divalent-cation tolerance protein CutA n=1 Tax=Sphingomicrobium arenosum TaxID=2233861 RepID=UPI002240DF01|nr:divalent-cation tolerance protein CutA [Sphingomicrobium arenosum]